MKITKEGFKTFEWNPDLQDYIEIEFRSLCALREIVSIEDGVTLADIIRFTAKDQLLSAFISEYSTCSVSAFARELGRVLLKPIDPKSDVSYCAVCAKIEIKDSFRSLPRRIGVSVDFHGRGDSDTTWALDLSPLEDIALLPVRVDDKAVICKFENETYERDETCSYGISLLEFLDAIFYDISFHGSPGDDRKQEIKESLTKAMKEIEDGTAKLVPFEPETIQ